MIITLTHLFHHFHQSKFIEKNNRKPSRKIKSKEDEGEKSLKFQELGTVGLEEAEYQAFIAKC